MDTPASPESTAETHPFCRHLRSKKYYFLKAPPRTEEDLLDGSQHCWCSHTGGQVGLDQEIVEPEDCRAGRECFESLLGSFRPGRLTQASSSSRQENPS